MALMLALRAHFHYGCALRCVASDSQRQLALQRALKRFNRGVGKYAILSQ